jgi:hypothetical protein
MAPVTDLAYVAHPSGLAAITLTWDHTGADRFVLGYNSGNGWVNLPPEPAASFGSGPYGATLPALPETSWRVLAMDAAGTVSS